MKAIITATYITIFATSITWANPSASEFGDVNLTTPVYTASETQQVVSNAVKDIPQSITNIVKGLTDAPITLKRDKMDLAVYEYDWDYSVISNIYPGIYYIDDKRIIDHNPSSPIYLYRYSEGAWDLLGYGNIYDGTYNISTAMDDYDELIHVSVPRNNYPTPNGEQLATTSTIQPLVTNIVRDVVNTVYDEKLAISWKQVMYDGNIYFVPVTNANITVVGD